MRGYGCFKVIVSFVVGIYITLRINHPMNSKIKRMAISKVRSSDHVHGGTCSQSGAKLPASLSSIPPHQKLNKNVSLPPTDS